MSEADSLGCYTVDVRRFISVCAIIRKIPITGIIEVDDIMFLVKLYDPKE